MDRLALLIRFILKLFVLELLFVSEADDHLVTEYPHAAVGSDGAFIDCPCNVNTNETRVLLGVNVSVPEDYGLFCGAWDQTTQECLVLDPPAYCSRPWCYVNYRECVRQYQPSTYFQNMYYSYQTCGYLDLFTRQVITPPPQGFFNGLLYNGLGKVQPDSMKNYAKVVATYLRELLESMSLDPDSVKHRATTQASKDAYSSSFTAMAHDIALGHLDFGFYSFWHTAERINFGISPVPLYADEFYFWTTQIGEEEVPLFSWKTVAKPFEPFSWDLWLLIAGTVIFAALNMACVEHGIAHTFRSPKAMAHELYEAFVSLCGGALVSKYNHPPSRIIALGFSVFIVVVLASFTGSTASFLLGRSTPQIASFEEAMSNRDPICYNTVVQSALVEIYPILAEIGVPIGWSTTSILENINNGVCKHAIAPMSESENPVSCDFVRVGDILVKIPVGPFVQQRYGPAFNYYHSKMREMGIWGSYKLTLFQPFSCPKDEDETGDDDVKEMQLTSRHMLGICIILIICSAISLLMHIFFIWEKVAMKKGLAASLSAESLREIEIEEESPNQEEQSPKAAPVIQETNQSNVDTGLASSAIEQTVLSRILELQTTMQNVKETVDVLGNSAELWQKKGDSSHIYINCSAQAASDNAGWPVASSSSRGFQQGREPRPALAFAEQLAIIGALDKDLVAAIGM